MLNLELNSPQETSVKKQLILPAALLLALGASTALSTSGAFAQDTTTAPATTAPAPAAPSTTGQNPAAAQHHPMMQGQHGTDHRFDFTAHAEGRIAYVKAELKITSAQESAFDKYAQAIRDNATTMQKNFQDMRAHRGQSVSAIDRVEQRAKMAQTRDQQEQAYLAAFRPLYASLSADQKKVADDLATPHFRHFGHDRSGPQRG
jgi:protein CpxP